MILIGEVAQFSDIAFNVILGGFGMFLLGIKLLGDGFKDAAGSKIRDYIERYTGNLLSAILVGTVITALMQSSTAATVISISLVRAGLMSLEAAIGISVGANLGTTVTALMIGLNIEAMGYYFVFIGAIILLTKKRYKSVGQIFFGLGITFVGLELMSDQLIILQDVPQFEAYLVKMSDNPWLALLAGTIGTAVINSSMAVIALVQKIYAGGGMSMVAASAFVYGSNVGTTLTAILASAGGSVSTKRAGWFHALYNVIGALITMLFIYPYSNFILYLNGKMGGSPEMAVGINHFVFNLIWVVGIIPFIPACIRLLKILIPGEDRIKEREKIEALDYELIKTFPDGAFQLAQKQTLQMADLVVESFETTHDYLTTRDDEDFDVIGQLEEMVNELDYNLTRYLLAIAKDTQLDGRMAEQYSTSVDIVKNIERMGDITTNIAGFYERIFENRGTFSDEALYDLETMYKLVLDMIQRSFKILKSDSLQGYEKLVQDEDYLDLIDVKYRERHFHRISDGICDDPIASSLYVDILASLERLGDHCINIVEKVKERNPEKMLETEIQIDTMN
ncbi:Na/Pi cotransporter family protein [Erysipelothrix rhusiopathiae]|uniref:Na/Pi-cotransporter II-like protein n=1 Tax=Erysipelothrix rhusiopathiae ATCC 19414 TaxID=525280 RepID=E7FXX8_ERYRH|nr:Na/Pi cotransporter family protein [Erysipelothrix rhusiopathiae]AYV35179.1 Na/Pi cotransporter family protein [Erysipelothrix rhusiopathiae]EFY08352.1 putative Na/Pi-cotransporter II-like protein [Erysipelothrix rhusiopathiae ATCC 19414]MCG4456421.1 Na/Pi cotransporter family protein [Erysipelothrix rhusiopathiae]MDE8043897.1 Na/Pi cotransporter family protein [Erysipelothrix rhusiopathiae]MDE8060384.1 Na/Pi cotransporter family protein [Erysipelothrix rhusiopathiae]